MQIPGLTEQQLAFINNLLQGYEVKLFGSRVKGNFRENSDLDLCILSEVPRSFVTKIIDAFEESDLPFTVDVILYKDCNDDFKKIINSTGIKLETS